MMINRFNFMEAQRGARVQTCDGRKVRILCTDRLMLEDYYPIIALVKDATFLELAVSYTRKGEYTMGQTSRWDLVMVLDKNGEFVYE